MPDEIKKFVEDLFSIEEKNEYEFRHLYGFTFVFKRSLIIIMDSATSVEIKPVAIIYEENGEYYLAPIDVVDDIAGLVKEYVENCIIS